MELPSALLLAMGLNSCSVPVDRVEFQAFKALRDATVMATQDCGVRVEGMAHLDLEASIPGNRARVQQALNMSDGSPVGDKSCLLDVVSAVSGYTILGDRDCAIWGGTHSVLHPTHPELDSNGLVVSVDCMPEDPAAS